MAAPASANGPQHRISIRACYRLFCSHPLLIATLLFLLYLYQLSPHVFSLLVSASPIIICTAVLLGALLSYDQKMETGLKMNNGIMPLNTCAFDHATVVQRDWGRKRARFAKVRKGITESGLMGHGFCKVRANGHLDIGSIPIARSSCGYQIENQLTEEVDGAKAEPMEGLVNTHKEDFLYSSPPEKSKQVEDDYQPVGASLADIISTLDEIDPLLDFENPQAMHEESDGRDGHEENEDEEEEMGFKEDDGRKLVITQTEDDQKNLTNLKSSELERYQCLENLIVRRTLPKDREENEEEGSELTDDEEELEEEETPRFEEEAGNKPLVTWTEDDEKNLKDLGSSELERDQRLENLIARRRALRNFSMIPDLNLIDLDDGYHPFQVAHISTTRFNPFNVPDESTHQSGVLNVPGSAPSIFLPRQNPFDYPDESPEGKRNVTDDNLGKQSIEMNQKENFDFVGNGLRRDFMEMNQKDALFCRHQSFSRGPNLMGDCVKGELFEVCPKDALFRRYQSFGIAFSRPEKQDESCLKPYFLPEHGASEAISHPSFQRNSSQVSNNSAFCSPSETELTSSHNVMELVNSGTETMPVINHVSEHIEPGSQSSDYSNSMHIDQDGTRDLDFAETKDFFGVESHISEIEHLLVSIDERYLKTGANGEKHSNRLCQLSISKANRHLKSVNDDGLETMEQARDVAVEDPDSSTKARFGGPEFCPPSQQGYSCHKEPVYDTSPSGAENNLLFSSSLSL
ncbi:hypothetical protein Nepgr_011110 [Nepenthes gracilis]|uniref:Uncharacterized protein n=1 Tax=Nepenthes gracilis TaxID=150966 RepID=A0AAD3XLZ5_NEPGR|nr:hypothetical protein Nepgr_011110 [Nepenthes gracilis]